MTFIDKLNELMKQNKISRALLSKELHIGKNQIKYWEDNGTIPEGATLLKIAEYFNVSVDYLLGKTNKKQVTPEEQPVDEVEQELLTLTSTMTEDERNAVLGYAARIIAKRKKED